MIIQETKNRFKVAKVSRTTSHITLLYANTCIYVLLSNNVSTHEHINTYSMSNCPS